MILLIDDLRSFKDPKLSSVSTVARTLAEGLEEIKRKSWASVWLDHDLGLGPDGKPEDIMPLIDYVSKMAFFDTPLDVERFYVHTSNTVGGNAMMKSLNAYGYEAVRVNAVDYFTVSSSMEW